MKKQLVNSSICRFIEILLAAILSILLTPYLIHNLGSSNYGLWVLVLSTLGWFNFLDLGLSTAIQRSIVIAIEKSNFRQVNKVFSVAVIFFSIIGVIAASATLILAYFPNILGIEAEKQPTAAMCLTILALKVFWDFILHCYKGIYNALLRLDIDANLSALNTVIKSALIYIYIIDFDILGAVFATIIADAITHTLKVYYAKKLCPQLKFQLKAVSKEEFYKLFHYSKHVIATSLAQSLNGRIDPVIISHILSLSMVTVYSVISRLIVQVEGLVTAIAGVFQPVFTKLYAQNKNFDDLFEKTLTVNFFIALLFYIPLCVFSKSFIILWIGPEYSESADLAIAIAFANLCKTISRPISYVLLAQANHQLLSIVNIAGTILNITLSLLLGNLYGLMGIAIGTSISFLFTDVFLHLILMRKYTSKALIPPLKSFTYLSLLFFTITYAGSFFVNSLEIGGWLYLSMMVIIFEIILLLLLWQLLLTEKMKSLMIGIIKSKIPQKAKEY